MTDLQVQRDFQVVEALLDQGVWMGRRVSVANQEPQKYLVLLVFVVTREIQVLEVKRGPRLLGPQALRGHLE